MTGDRGRTVVEFVGVYHADGGLTGEARYVVGHLLGRTHCSLCDITHSPLGRKRAWDRMVEAIGVPFVLLHLNEMPHDVAAVIGTAGSPAVLARLREGHLVPVLEPDALEALDGTVSAFASALHAEVRGRGWHLAVRA